MLGLLFSNQSLFLIKILIMDLADNWKKHCSSCMTLISNFLLVCNECEVKLCLQCFVSQVSIGKHTPEHYVYIMNLGTFPVFKPSKTKSKLQDSEDDDSVKNELDEEKIVEQSEEKEQEENEDDEILKIAQDSENLDDFLSTFSDKLMQAGKFPEFQLTEEEKENEEKHVWTALDEVALLEAISRHGFGNWKEISKTISNSTKLHISASEAESHYQRHYIDGIIGRLTWMFASLDPNIQQLSNFPRGTNFLEDMKANHQLNENFVDIPQSELDALGYLPKRDDYEKEFDNDAEALIANLFIGAPDEDELERKFKFAQVDMYQRRLIQRFRKKAIVKENDLLTQFYNHVIAKNETKEEISHDKPRFASLMRFFKCFDSNCLISDLLKEHYLKIFLKRFMKYYFAGLNTADDIQEFEEKVKGRNILKRYLVDNESSKTEIKVKKFKKDKKRKIIDKDTPSTSRDVEQSDDEDSFETMFEEEDDFDKEIAHYLLTNDSYYSMFEITKKIVDEINSDETKEFLEKSSELLEKDPTLDEEYSSLMPTSTQIELRSSILRKAAKIFKVDDLKGSNLLSDSEKKLCTELKLSPLDYIKYKTLIIKHWSDKSLSKSRTENADLFSSAKLVKFFDLNPENEEIIRKISKYLESIGITSNKK